MSGDRLLCCLDSDQLTPAGETALAAILPALRLQSAIEVHGFASPEGPAGREVAYNHELSCHRANKVHDLLVAAGIPAGRITTFAHGGTSEFGSRANNRAVVIPLRPVTPGPVPSPPTTTTIEVTAKSYIGDPLSMGSLPGRCTLEDIVLSGTPLPSSGVRLLAFSTVVALHENPITPRMDGRYRLFSRRRFDVTCDPASGASVVASGIATDVGDEPLPGGVGTLHPPAITLTNTVVTPVAGGRFHFAWMARGRPNALAEPGFQGVCPRVSRFIWHRVEGDIECKGGAPVVTAVGHTGSQFPSHRLWIDSVLRSNIPQHNLADLWRSSGSDATLVN